jgi:hypothetical protein
MQEDFVTLSPALFLDLRVCPRICLGRENMEYLKLVNKTDGTQMSISITLSRILFFSPTRMGAPSPHLSRKPYFQKTRQQATPTEFPPFMATHSPGTHLQNTFTSAVASK